MCISILFLNFFLNFSVQPLIKSFAFSMNSCNTFTKSFKIFSTLESEANEDPDSLVYQGDRPESENCVSAFAKLFRHIQPRIQSYWTLHSYGQRVFVPFTHTSAFTDRVSELVNNKLVFWLFWLLFSLSVPYWRIDELETSYNFNNQIELWTLSITRLWVFQSRFHFILRWN